MSETTPEEVVPVEDDLPVSDAETVDDPSQDTDGLTPQDDPEDNGDGPA